MKPPNGLEENHWWNAQQKHLKKRPSKPRHFWWLPDSDQNCFHVSPHHEAHGHYPQRNKHAALEQKTHLALVAVTLTTNERSVAVRNAVMHTWSLSETLSAYRSTHSGAKRENYGEKKSREKGVAVSAVLCTRQNDRAMMPRRKVCKHMHGHKSHSCKNKGNQSLNWHVEVDSKQRIFKN